MWMQVIPRWYLRRLGAARAIIGEAVSFSGVSVGHDACTLITMHIEDTTRPAPCGFERALLQCSRLFLLVIPICGLPTKPSNSRCFSM